MSNNSNTKQVYERSVPNGEQVKLAPLKVWIHPSTLVVTVAEPTEADVPRYYSGTIATVGLAP